MNRTTKALARLGTLAIFAGTALGTPLAIGTASATVVPGDITVINGSIVSNEAAAAGDYSPNANNASVTVSGPDAVGDIIQLGGSAYFPIGEPAGATDSSAQAPVGVTYVSPTKVICTATPCRAAVDDPVAEQATVTVVDPDAPATNASTKVSFNGLFYTTCPSTGIQTGETGGVAYGTPVGDTTAQNCATQGQFGAGTPVSITVHYAASSQTAPAENVGQGLQIDLTQIAPDTTSHISAIQGVTTGTIDPGGLTAHCNTDSAGNCVISITNAGPVNLNTLMLRYTERSSLRVITENTTGDMPKILTTPGGGVAPTERIRWTRGSVVPTRLNLVDSQVLFPDTQGASGVQTEAEPGDAIQLTYKLTGGCTPDTTVDPDPDAPFETCAGIELAGLDTTVAVDHGFFTPNCVSGGVVEYVGCSFTTAPADGVVVGNLTSSGATQAVHTNVHGNFTVTVGIGRDAAFDQNGLITTHITDGALKSVRFNPQSGFDPTNGRSVGDGCPSGSSPAVVKGLLTGLGEGSGNDQCAIDFTWTTREAPLNGGTSKLVAIPALAQPNNTAIQTENNSNATDSGTTNVPDVNRVDFVVHNTDQFGNLTTAQDGYLSGEASGAPVLTKTGPGWMSGCGSFSSTNACINPGGTVGITPSGQPDGTTTQVTKNGLGSYLANVNDQTSGFGTGQQRGQLDTADGDNDAWPCSTAFGFGGLACLTGLDFAQPGVNDGTTTLTDSWAAPTTKFKGVITSPTPISTQYLAGTAAAATDVFTINFYNQLAQPVVTFAVKPGTTVPTGTAVTVQATVVDQFGNGIVNQLVDAVRSGANEASCTPSQNLQNGGNVTTPLQTNTSGISGYTFTCDAPGASNVSMVVLGPGGTQLAQGRETVHFTGNVVKVKGEKPTIKSIKSKSAGRLTLHIRTHPALAHVRINIYRKLNGLYHKIGSVKTGAKGHATKRLAGLHRGVKYNVAVKAVNIGAGYHSHYSKHKTVRIS